MCESSTSTPLVYLHGMLPRLLPLHLYIYS